MSLESVMMSIEEEGAEFVRFEFGDMYGISRSKIIPARHFEKKAVSGIKIPFAQLVTAIDGSDFHNTTTYGDDIIGPGDVTCFPVLNTFRMLPWYPNTATIFVEPTYKSKPVAFYPRCIARNQLNRLSNLGLSLLVAHEHEFYVVDRQTGKPFIRDNCLRATVRNYTDPDFVYQLMRDLHKVGIDVEMCDSETGCGQMEITYKPTFGIVAADNAFLFKTTVKEIAQKYGYIASFMSKPYRDQVGSSAHLNHSLWDKEGKTNMLCDPAHPTGLSEIGRQWMAGILNHSRAISMLMAPTVNCYKRFGKESYVNNQPTWGNDNRSCMLRVQINGPDDTYIENRSTASGSNPYLTLAATIAAGIDGIERSLQLPPETTNIAFELNNDNKTTPNNLKEAMDAFMTDDVISQAFGSDFYEAFFALKSTEFNAQDSEGKVNEKENYLLHRKLFFEYL